MHKWEFAVALEREGNIPVFLQLARAVADDIRRGRLKPGDPLPGSRTLAGSLQVHRNTVLAAYAELAAEGWITTSAARGTFVSRALPDRIPRRFSSAMATRQSIPSRVGFDLRPAPELIQTPQASPGLLVFATGTPDVRLVPVAALSRAYRRTLRLQSRLALNYAAPHGHPALRAALAGMLSSTRGLAARADEVFVTRGSQMALALVARAIVSPGDVVAVEQLGYRQGWEALRAAGARLIPLPLDEEGVSADALQDLTRRERVRAVYLTPHHQYPTTVTLAAGRRLRLLELARAQRIAIVEDDYDHEFHYDGRPVLPLASVDQAGVVVYIGTLSKVLAPGLRVGYVVAPPALVDRLAAHRAFIDVQGDYGIEGAVAELLDEGEVQRHVRRVRRIYMARRDALVRAIASELGGALVPRPAPGGIAIWAEVGRGIDVEAWAARARDAGVLFHTAKHFAFDGRPRPFVRLGFASMNEQEMQEAVRRMAIAVPRRQG
jgi:GntR family transcriptional regulator/MocR family aminotransferase